MKFSHIWGVILRNTYTFKHNFEESADVIFWPSMEILLWGITGYFFSSLNPSFSNIVIMLVSGLIFWQIAWRSQFEMNLNLLKELWNKNLINLFSTPLKFSEWITAHIFLGIAKIIVGFIFGALLSYILYKANIFSVGYYILPFMGLLILSGWWIGFLVLGFILRYGQRVQIFAWAFITILSPFSAIFYPVSILPGWAQKISMVLPMSYIFEGMREVILNHQLDGRKLAISLGLNIFYIVLALVYLNFSYRKVLKKGLINMS